MTGLFRQRRLLIGAAAAAFLYHEIFHAVDGMAGAFGYYGLWWLRLAMFPFPRGGLEDLTVHAGIFLVTQAALIAAWMWVGRTRRKGDEFHTFPGLEVRGHRRSADR